ncbi:uroporphyrinogen-III synthase [Rosenbergiella sp. S61]|uniref:Uroporphyrinogen-III synthase n=1 Tax=Rosenbergiella gaditana TaxID=2726987 RepID=A0ABS5T0A4_9GAMM|nr:uroporphyrinogen-III synthase [Rosenbergiella gaditana]MBT0725592.1 uroporphyrinogen-III synthase [Rosenbergiella gaditana]
MSILVTRPFPEGQQLVDRLRLTGRQAWHLPLIDFLPGHQLPEFSSQLATLNRGDLIIAVSARVLTYVGPYLLAENTAWPADVNYFAIGKNSALALHRYCQQAVDFPETTLSEHLLDLPLLENIAGKNCLILRGNNGRELLGQTLQSRGAHVTYFECYQRVAINYHGAEQAFRWRQKGISTIIVTSGEMVNLLYELIPALDRNEWLLHCRLVVVSERLATIATDFGWRDIIVADGADNDALLRALR